jgi:hypothetical protein
MNSVLDQMLKEDVLQLAEVVEHATAILFWVTADISTLLKTRTASTTMDITMQDFPMWKSMEEVPVVNALLVT